MSDVNPAVGIDLGTTNTVVSVQTDSLGPRILEIPQPQYERKQFDNLSQIKSAVYFESEATAVVGSFASERLESFRSIKSHMGTRWQAIHPYAEHPLTPAYLSAHILGLAHQSILKQFPRWDRTALITVPASFNTDQRNDTISAARMAGFRDIRLLDEPTAAFCYFFSQHSDSDFKEMRSILVFDFGGGTLDVSIIEINAAKDGIIIDTFGRSRYNNLGGDDIDLELAVFLIACWEYDTGNDLKDIPTELRSNIYKLFINKSRLYKEEVEDYLKNELGMPEFYIKEKIPKAGKEREIAFKRILNRSQYEEITGRYFQSKSGSSPNRVGKINVF